MVNKHRLFFLLVIFVIISCVNLSTAQTDYNLTYDSNGNLIQGFGKYYEYNPFNQLERVRDTNSTGRILVEYSYDSDGSRLLKKEFFIGGTNQSTYYIDNNFVQIRNSSGIFNFTYYYDEYGLVAEKISGGQMRYYHPDHLGSTTLITNGTGAIVEETFYLPYGEIIEGGNNSRYLYTGKERDNETQLYYYGARYYNSFFSHFIQPDSVLSDVYDPQQLNRYSYARDNPYSYIDSSGNYIESALDIGFISWDIRDIIKNPINWVNYASLGLDVVGLALPFVTGLGEGFKIGVKGLSKIDNLLDVEKISTKATSSLDIIDKSKDLIKSWSKSNFRENLLKELGESGIGKEAHHNIPQKFADWDVIKKSGIDINDPKFGSLIDKQIHRSTAYSYNKEFENFLIENPNANAKQIIDQARDISNKFEFNPKF
ncbi:MAG: hypothetical protein NTZ83_01935 [Candidatus Pacearchaeota archaeon]|nr:hypothetical protein [Candidatus Pacearchaeota archaeon]